MPLCKATQSALFHFLCRFQYCLEKILLASKDIQNPHNVQFLTQTSTSGAEINYTTGSANSSQFFGLSNIFDEVGTATYSSHRIPEVRQILIYCYAILIVCGTTFNLAVLFALLYFREQTFTNIANIFVFTLAASDVVLCGVSMPIQLYYGIDENSQVNTALCRTLFAGFGIPMYVSCLTILLIAIDRHRLIVKPTVPRVSIKTVLQLILITVVFSALNAVPVGMYTESKGIDGFQSFCVETWPSSDFRLVYSIAIFIIHFLLPLLVSGGLYLEIYGKLAIRPEQLSLSKESGRRKRRTTTLLACVVVCFAICWTPWCLFSLLAEVDAYITKSVHTNPFSVGVTELTAEQCKNWLSRKSLADGDNQTSPWSNIFKAPLERPPLTSFIRGTHFTLIDMVLKLWAMGSACVNPFLYGWLNRPIREAMITLYESISGFCLRSLTARSARNQRINALSEQINGKSSKLSLRSSCGAHILEMHTAGSYHSGIYSSLKSNNKDISKSSKALFTDTCCLKKHNNNGEEQTQYLTATKQSNTKNNSQHFNNTNRKKEASSPNNNDNNDQMKTPTAAVVVIVEGPTNSH